MHVCMLYVIWLTWAGLGRYNYLLELLAISYKLFVVGRTGQVMATICNVLWYVDLGMS